MIATIDSTTSGPTSSALPAPGGLTPPTMRRRRPTDATTGQGPAAGIGQMHRLTPAATPGAAVTGAPMAPTSATIEPMVTSPSIMQPGTASDVGGSMAPPPAVQEPLLSAPQLLPPSSGSSAPAGDMTAGQGRAPGVGTAGAVAAAPPIIPIGDPSAVQPFQGSATSGTPAPPPFTPTPPTPPPLPVTPSAVMPPAPGAATTATAATAPTSPVPTAAIDPENDLRAQAILPTDDPALSAARSGFESATAGVTGFDRAKAIRDAMGAFGNTPTDVSAGPAVDPGKDYSGDINTADAATMGALNKVTGTDRAALVSGLRDQNVNFLGNTDVAKGAAVDPTGSARLEKYGAMTDDAASKLSTVDRVKLAEDTLNQFDEAQLPEHEMALRQLTNKFAALGGARSGMLRTSYGDEDLARQRDRDLLKKQLVTAATEGTIQDQLNKTNTLSGLENTLAGREAGVRGEQRAERDYGTAIDTGNVTRGLATKTQAANMATNEADATMAGNASALDAARGVSGDLSSRQTVRGANQRADRSYTTGVAQSNADRALAAQDANRTFGASVAGAQSGDALAKASAARDLYGTLSNEGAADRAETRGERTYQNGQEQRSYDRAVTEDQLGQSDQDRQQARALALLNAGNAGNPSNILASLSQGGGLDAATIARLASSLGQGSVGGGTAAAPSLPGGLTPEQIAAMLRKAGVGGAAQNPTDDIPIDYTH